MTSNNWDKKWDREEIKGIARFCTQIVENEELNRWKINEGTIVEAGCGLGRNLLHMSSWGNAELVGIDYSPKVVEQAKELFKNKKVKAKFVVDDINKLNLEDNSVDIIFNQGVIEHFRNPEIPLKEMIRVSKKKVIILVPNTLSWDGLISFIVKGLSKVGLYDYKTRFPYDWVYFFTKRSLCNMLEELGCEIVYAKTIGVVPILPLPAKYFPRFMKKLFYKLEKWPLPKREIFVVAEKV